MENDVCVLLKMLAFFRMFELFVSSICFTFAIVSFIGPFLGIMFLVIERIEGSAKAVVYCPSTEIFAFFSLICWRV